MRDVKRAQFWCHLPLLQSLFVIGVNGFESYWGIYRGKLGNGERSGMANDRECRTVQYLVEGVKVINCFHPRMLAPPKARVITN